MHSATRKFERVQGFRLSATIGVGLAVLLVSCVHLSFAQKMTQQTFASAEEASHALFLAIQSGNEQAIMQILGCGEELVSSDDQLEDKLDREQFATKYQELHRLVQEPDGTTLLYVGAENWPFPIPLASKTGRWHFDSEAGAQEILFRRIGENEATAIETCHALVLASQHHDSEATGDDPVSQYARTLLSAQAGNAGSAPANEEETSAPFGGYNFRELAGQGKGSNVSTSTTRGRSFVAYPAEYRSSGVMTFIVTQDEVVYEKDLGPSTARVAKAMTAWRPDSSWHVAEFPNP